MARKGDLGSQDWEWAGDNDQSDVPPCVWREVDPRGRCGLWGLRASEIVAHDIKGLPATRFTTHEDCVAILKRSYVCALVKLEQSHPTPILPRRASGQSYVVSEWAALAGWGRVCKCCATRQDSISPNPISREVRAIDRLYGLPT
jgi:hypothetical protein